MNHLWIQLKAVVHVDMSYRTYLLDCLYQNPTSSKLWRSNVRRSLVVNVAHGVF